MEKQSKFKNQYVKIGFTAFLVIAAGILFFFFIFCFRGIMSTLAHGIAVFQPVIIGLVIAYLVSPIADGIETLLEKGIGRFSKRKTFARQFVKAVSVFTALAVFVFILFLIILMIVPQFLESISALIKTVPGEMESLIDTLSKELKKHGELEEIVLSVYRYGVNWLQNDLAGYVASFASSFASGVLGVLSFLKNFLIGFIFALYLLFNKKILMRQLRKFMFAFLKPKTVLRLVRTGRRANKIFSGFLYGKLLDSFIIGVLCFLGIWAMKMPYTMLVAVVIGVTNIIPVFGPYLGAVPCAALILLYDPIKGLSFIAFIVLLQALDGNFIGPKILGNSTGLSAFWVVFAIVVAGGLFGVIGMLVGVPVFAVIYYLATSVVNHRLADQEMPTQSDYYDESIVDKMDGGEPCLIKTEDSEGVSR